MIAVLQPWQIFVAALASWITRQQDAVIEYLREENRVLKQQLGRRALAEVASLVTPDTILRWHRQLIAQKWTHERRSPGRRRVMQAIEELTVQMARENPRWGYTRIQGELKNLGHRVGRTTIADILKRNGIDPDPRRGKQMTWSQFLKAHWDVLAAADFFTVEVWGLRGLVTFDVFFVIELETRRIEIAGVLADKKYLILDRDSKYSGAFRSLLADAGVKIVRLPHRSPNLNAYAERFVRSIKDECLDRMIFFGERSLRKATREFAAHHHAERNHQGLENRLIEPDGQDESTVGPIRCLQRLGGMLRFYHRAAA